MCQLSECEEYFIYISIVFKMNPRDIGMEIIREIKFIRSCWSKAETRWICGKGCYASNPCGSFMPSASCTFETTNVGNCGIVDIQNWNGHDANEAGLPWPKTKEGWR